MPTCRGSDDLDDKCIISTITSDPDELNNNGYNNKLKMNSKFNGLPDVFTDVDITGPYSSRDYYLKDDLHTPYTLYNGKFWINES